MADTSRFFALTEKERRLAYHPVVVLVNADAPKGQTGYVIDQRAS